MAITVHSETTGGTTTSGTDGTFAVTKPATVSNGDVMVVVVGKQAGGTVAPPAGWTTGAQEGFTTGNDVYLGIFYKPITNAAGEPASYTFDSSGTNEQVGWWIGSLSGVASLIVDVTFTNPTNKQNDTSPNCPAVTTATDNAFALACWCVNNDNATTQPGGSWAARADDVGGNGCLNVASQTFATAGTTTGTPEITDVAASQESAVGMWVFRAYGNEKLFVTHAGIYLEIDESTEVNAEVLAVTAAATAEAIPPSYIGLIQNQTVLPPAATATAAAIPPYAVGQFEEVLPPAATATAAAPVPAFEAGPVGTIADLTATAVSSSQIDLAWTDPFADETGYVVERSLDGLTGWTEIDDIAADSNSYSDITCSPNTTYYYRVGGYNATGTTYSNVASARTSADTPEPFQRWLVWDRVLQQIRETDIRYVALVDGVPEPDTDTGVTWVYVDQTTGDLMVKFGDGTKYVLQSVTAKVKETRVDAVRTTLGAAAPTATTRAVGASGGVLMPVLSFSKTIQQDTHFTFHYPPDLDPSVNVAFHLMWIPGASWSAGNYMWKLEYLIKNELTGVVTSGTPTTIQADVTPANATTLIETAFASAIDLNNDEILIGHFYRDVANDNGDDVGEVLFFEISYTMADSW